MVNLKLFHLLKENNLTILQLSEATGISRSTLNAMANNNTKGIQFTTIDELCNYFDCEIQDLIEFSPSVPAPKLKKLLSSSIKLDWFNFILVYECTFKNKIYELGIDLTVLIKREVNKNEVYIKADFVDESNLDLINQDRSIKQQSGDSKHSFSFREVPYTYRKQYYNSLLPIEAEERAKAVFKYFDIVINNWGFLREEIESLDSVVRILWTANIPITSFFDVPYRIDEISELKTNDNNLFLNVLSKMDELISKKTKRIKAHFSYDIVSANVADLLSFDMNTEYIIDRIPARENVEYKTIKIFD